MRRGRQPTPLQQPTFGSLSRSKGPANVVREPTLAQTLRGQHRVQVTALPADLSSTEAIDGLTAEARNRGLHVDILVNNAGPGVFEDFLDTSIAWQVEQVDLKMRALVSLTHAFALGMVAARRGGVINVASTAAFQPLAGATVYAASKAFVLFFSEGLALELEKTGVEVTAACPGPVATRFFADKNSKALAEQMDQPGLVVGDILRGFEQGKKVVYPGRLAVRLGTLGARFLPRKVILRLCGTKRLNRRLHSRVSRCWRR